MVVTISGCAGKIFQPSPPAFLNWISPGSSVVEVKKKLLECGMPEPTSKTAAYYELSINERASISFCMERSGFHRKSGRSTWCENYREIDLPVCSSGAVIPTPSVERRLNSPYCRGKTDFQYCKKNARFPEACVNNDYDNPAPECVR